MWIINVGLSISAMVGAPPDGAVAELVSTARDLEAAAGLRLAPDLALAPDGVLDRERLIALVLARNPELDAARLAWVGSQQQALAATALDDPMLGYSFAPRSVLSNRVPYGQVVSYSQAVPYPGTRRLRGEAATAEAEAMRQEVEEHGLVLANLASRLFDDYYEVERALEIIGDHLELVGSYQRIAAARYAAGAAPQQAMLQAEVELTHLLHDRIGLEADRREVRARLNLLLHRDPTDPLPPPPRSLPDTAAPDQAGIAAATAQSLEVRPEARRLAAELEARRVETRLAELAFRPDLELMASYDSMWSDAEHQTMVGVTVNLPVFKRRLRADQAAAEARVTATLHELEALGDQIRAEVAILFSEVEEAHHVVELYRDRLLPAAADQVTSALAGFRTGQASFLELIDAERNQRSVRLAYERSVAEVHRQRADLDRALGRLPGGGSVGDHELTPPPGGEQPEPRPAGSG